VCTYLSAALLAIGCGGSAKKPAPIAVANAGVGDCGDPERSGVIGSSPEFVRADRDLDGDGATEVVIADRDLCKGENCYWNLFAEQGGCKRYIGTASGASLDRLEGIGEDRFRDLRAWWRLSSGGRVMLHIYEFRLGGYRLAEALVCRQNTDDRILCASEGPK